MSVLDKEKENADARLPLEKIDIENDKVVSVEVRTIASKENGER